MNTFLDITVHGPEVMQGEYMQELFRLLHSFLRQHASTPEGTSSIGILFPDWNEKNCGRKIRAFGPESLVSLLLDARWMIDGIQGDVLLHGQLMPFEGAPRAFRRVHAQERVTHEAIMTRLKRTLKRSAHFPDKKIPEDLYERVGAAMRTARDPASQAHGFSIKPSNARGTCTKVFIEPVAWPDEDEVVWSTFGLVTRRTGG